MNAQTANELSYWHGHAADYSRRVEFAAADVQAAEKALVETMQDEYPRECLVRVVHHRGEFTAKVTGWDHRGARICVRNITTGKESMWWAAQVERVGGDS